VSWVVSLRAAQPKDRLGPAIGQDDRLAINPNHYVRRKLEQLLEGRAADHYARYGVLAHERSFERTLIRRP
jgi:hypothetical protein